MSARMHFITTQPLPSAARRFPSQQSQSTSAFSFHPSALPPPLPPRTRAFQLSSLIPQPFLVALLIFLLSAFPISAFSSEPQQNSNPVSASITVSKAQLYERETFLLTLTIRTTGVQIRQKLDLTNLPDKRRVDLFTPFETLPTERTGDGHRITEIHRYRCRARALTAGTIRLAPNLKLIALRRRRMLIGSAWEETPVQVSIAPLHLAVKPLPTPPAGFSGAIGSFAMSAAIDPADIVQGDLVTLTTRISGRGFTDGMQQPGIRATPQFKVYDPKRVHASPDLLVFEQVIIPQSAEVSAIPEVGLTYFDTNAGTYKHLKGGPFPIAFHDATAETLEHFRPTDAGAAPSQSQPDAPEPPGLLDRLRRLLGHARYEQAVCSATTEAHMAPSSTSFSSFELQPGTEVSILRQHAEWLLIESEAQRGWIPRAAVNP